ncbi:hypothetical protein TNCV_2961891 [Trichonephila clavipes]|nr:hypothetical protein TNCV_2961891 [Trichonephila clavipes]
MVRNHLNATYRRSWIESGGPVAWSPHFPDLNSLDFIFWGHLKLFAYNNCGATSASHSTCFRSFRTHQQHTKHIPTFLAIRSP